MLLLRTQQANGVPRSNIKLKLIKYGGCLLRHVTCAVQRHKDSASRQKQSLATILKRHMFVKSKHYMRVIGGAEDFHSKGPLDTGDVAHRLVEDEAPSVWTTGYGCPKARL
eukprot:5726126-Amphidinium_carterae.1